MSLILLIGAVSAGDETNFSFENETFNNELSTNGSDFNSFAQLNTTINNQSGGNVKLVNNYKYCENDTGFKRGITINQSNIVVDGQGHLIDCDNKSEIFNILGNNVSLKNIVFKGCIYWEGSYGLIDNCTFINCTTFVNFDDEIFVSGDVVVSELIYWNGSFGSITNCNFINCTNCNAITSIGDNGRIFNSTFINCSGSDHLIRWDSDNSSFKDCIFKNCNYQLSVVEIGWKDNVSLINSTFINCTSYNNGGSIYWRGSNGSIFNSTFINCSSNGYGGAIYWYGNNGNVINSVFLNNNAAGSGGAIYFESHIFEKWNVVNCQFINNTAHDLGSAIKCYYGVGFINDSNFTNNIIDVNKEEVTLDNCIFTYTDEFSNIFNNLKPNSQINLTKDYIINWNLQINVENITINGNGHRIAGFSKTVNFLINAASITFRDIQFENISFNWDGDRGNILNCNFTNYTTYAFKWSGNYGNISNSNFNNASISWYGDCGIIFNCNFSNFNTVVYGGGGVIHWDSNHGIIEKSSFINCSIGIYGSGSISGQYFGGGIIYCAGVNNSIVNCSFLNCKNVNYFYGLIYYLESSDGEIIGCNFTNCSCIRSGAISCWDSTLNINNCNFINCNASYGGAIYFTYANGSIIKCNFINSTGENGGAVYFTHCNVNVINCNFINNTAGLGNAIYSYQTNGDINNTIFINNDIYDYSKYLELNNCVFNNTDEFARLFINLKPNSIINLTKDYTVHIAVSVDVENITIIGNGHILDSQSRIFTIRSHNVTLKDIVFKNSKSYEGGSIYWDGNDGNIINCSFINSKSSRGGSIYWNGLRGHIAHSTFINCSSTSLGDAILWNGNYGIISNSQFIDCFNHGAICWDGSFGSIFNSTFINCTNCDDGGAIKCYGSYTNITYCNFTNCNAQGIYTAYGGGAIYCSCTHVNISNCNFLNCSSNNDGGVIHCSFENSTIFNCTFINCTSKANGGAIYFRDPDSNVLNSRFINCTSLEYAGAIYFDIQFGKYSSVLNCNFTNCTSINNNSAIYWIGENGSVIGCICDDVLSNGKNSTYKYFNFNLNESYEINFGEDLILNPITDENVEGYVEVYIDGKYNSFVFRPSESCILNNLAVGTHSIEFIYLGSDSYGRNKYMFSLTVKDTSKNKTVETELDLQNQVNTSKISSKINASNVNTVYNKHKYLTVTLQDDKGNTLKNKSVIISIKNKKYLFKTDLKGQINIETKNYNPATYNVVINFMGDDKYKASSKTVQFKVRKQTPIFKVSKKTFKLKLKTKKLQVTLKDANNRPIKNVKISLKINSKTYTSKTKSNGLVIFKIKLTKVGNYNAIIKFAGSKFYNSLTKPLTISVKK